MSPPPTDRTPLPLGSEADDAANSGAKILTKAAARAIAKAQEDERRAIEKERREADEVLAKSRRLKSYIWAAVGLVVSTGLTVGGVILYINSTSDTGVQRAMVPWVGRVVAVESDVGSMKEIVGKVERDGIRNGAMLEMTLRERGMVPPPHQVIIPFTPTPDGGR